MAKRKRLEIPAGAPAPKTTSPTPLTGRMPIADVAADTAARAALDEVSRTLSSAEAEGRMVHRISLEAIDLDHLDRDRMVVEPEEFAALTASLAERGQQSPVEVLRRPGGRFGLISGLRRILALQKIGAPDALAFVRQPASAAEAYVAMVEENEIRAGLSFYERANIAVAAVASGVFPSPKAAVKALYANVTPAKRSKILRFVVLRKALGKSLSFPAAIPEKLGLALAAAIDADPAVATRIADALRKTPPADAGAERRVLERALKAPATPKRGTEIAPGIVLQEGRGTLTLSGARVDAAFAADLRDWIAQR